MKSHFKFSIALLLGLFCFSTALYAQKNEAKKMAGIAEKAKKEVEKAVKEVDDLFEKKDCSKFKNNDINDIQKAIRKAKEQAAQARAAAGAATDAVTNTRSARDRAEAKGHETNAKEAADAAEKALAEVLKKLPGITAADKIIEELEEVEVTDGNSDKQKIVARLKDAAEKAGYKFPCDPDLVKKEVENAFDDELRKYRGNGELKPWIKKLKESFDDKELISFAPPEEGAYLRFGEHHSHYSVEFFIGEEKYTVKGADYYVTSLYGEIQQQLFSDPELFSQMFETLGGEFFFGDFTDPSRGIDAQHSNGRTFGLNGQAEILPHLIGEAGYNYGCSTITGRFPVTIFDNFNGEATTAKGTLSLRQSTHSGRLGIGYQLGDGIIKIAVAAGLQFNRTTTSKARARIDEFVIERNWDDSIGSIGPYGKTSIEVYPLDGFFIRTSVFAGSGKIRTGAEKKEQVWTPGIGIGAGLKF